MLPAGLRLHGTTVAALAIDTATLLIIFRSLKAADAGVYQMAQQMVAFLLVVPQAVGAMLHARLAANDVNEDWPAHRRVIMQTVTLLIVLAISLGSAADVVTNLIGGPAFAPASDMFRLLLLTLAGPSLALMLAPQWIGRGVFSINAALTVGAAAALLTLTFMWVDTDGVQGAVNARVAVFAFFVLPVQVAFMVYVARVHRRYRSGLDASTIRSP
jgi:enterobacterial common antigen flippase